MYGGRRFAEHTRIGGDRHTCLRQRLHIPQKVFKGVFRPQLQLLAQPCPRLLDTFRLHRQHHRNLFTIHSRTYVGAQTQLIFCQVGIQVLQPFEESGMHLFKVCTEIPPFVFLVYMCTYLVFKLHYGSLSYLSGIAAVVYTLQLFVQHLVFLYQHQRI